MDMAGVTPENLLDAPATGMPVPTFDDHIPRLAQAVTAGTLRVYQGYWDRVRDVWGGRRLDVDVGRTALRPRRRPRLRRTKRPHRPRGTTATYVRADLYETVVALAALTGEPHPLLTDMP